MTSSAEHGNPTVPVTVGPDCPDVMVIAARGTGEPPLSSPASPADYAKLPDHGAGNTLWDMYNTYLTKLRPDLTFSLMPAIYTVPTLDTLPHFASALWNFDSDAAGGASGILFDMQLTDARCGHTVRYVLAGYSIGAWAVHDALSMLSSQQKLGEIAGVALFGDPEFVPGQPFIRAFADLDVNRGLAAGFFRQDSKIPGPVQASTGSWCFPADPVCQALPSHLTEEVELQDCVANKCAHEQYMNQETREAARFLAPLMPGATQFPKLNLTPPDGTVGTPYEWTAAATPPGSYTWSVSGDYPLGLSISTSGTLSGTPAKAGTYTFGITAASTHHRETTVPVTLTISPASGGSGSGSWAAAKAPLPADAAAEPLVGIYSVACPSATACVAIGQYTDSSEHRQGLLLIKSGSSWTAVRAPLPSDAAADPSVSLAAVACPAASACVVAGSYAVSKVYGHALLITGSGTSWTATEAPVPADAPAPYDAGFSAVACSSVSACVATGSYGDTGGGMLDTGAGTSWTATAAPQPANALAGDELDLNAVTCTSSSTCIVAGRYFDSAGDSQGLLITGSGTSWAATEAPVPDAAANPAVLFNDIACGSASACTATGTYVNPNGSRQSELVTGSGISWAATAAPSPPEASTAYHPFLGAPVCPSASLCVIPGNFYDQSTQEFGLTPFMVTGSGSSWSAAEVAMPPSAPANPQTDISGAACASSSACVAAGDYADASGGNGKAMLVTGSGTSWSAAEAPVPADGAQDPETELFAVACPSASSCVAVGEYRDSAGHSAGLLVTGPATAS